MEAFIKIDQGLKRVFATTDNIQCEVSQSEIHHRIRNNLNTIASILGLQINTLDTVTEKNTKKILKNSKQRIEAIAMNHESLYQNYDDGEVSFNLYTRNLTDMISKVSNRNILVQVESNHISLPIETMFLIGIILSELFTNSIKYAFEEDKGGDQVKISLSQHGNHYLFSYHESRNENIDIEKMLNSQTLGIRLVKLIVKQLEGTFEVTRNRGLIFTVEFLAIP